MKIIVDADACPVMNEVVEVAGLHGIQVLMVSDYSHALGYNMSGVTVRNVDGGMDAVDLCVLNECSAGDVVVTNDIGLASMLLPKGAHVLSPSGRLYDASKIDDLLERRHFFRILRRAGARMRGSSKKFTRHDRATFKDTLTRLLS